MRFGMIAAAAAALVCAGQAQAATVITQTFDSTFSRVGSRGPVPVGALNLVNQVITSAVITYRAGQGYSQDIFSPTPNNPATLSYSGSSGFALSSLPVPVTMSVAFSGTKSCTLSNCFVTNDISGDYIIPQADLATFAGSNYISLAALVNISGSVSASSPLLFQARETYAYASGTITYLIADVAAVPEPATWAMMILGMGFVGFAMRRRRTAGMAVAPAQG